MSEAAASRTGPADGAPGGNGAPSADAPGALLSRLREPAPLLAVELRPPRSDLGAERGMEAWIDMHHAVRRLTRDDGFVFLTDNAVGESEEENLNHLVGNLGGEVEFGRLVPFLTCKHTLEYCLLYAERAASRGFEALTVVGGDEGEGHPRCLPHAYMLRQKLRRRVPALDLGGWANPHRSAPEQVGYLVDGDFHGDYYLTQVVSHHDAGRVEAFLREGRRRGLEAPGVFGVFFYRSANPDTLETLSRFFPVPAEALTREFDAGRAPEEICAESIRALRSAGARHVYVSNLGLGGAARRLRKVREKL